MAKRFKDIEKQAKKELEQEDKELAKRVVKARLVEIQSAKRVLSKLEKQYKDLLKKEVADVHELLDG